MIETPTLNEGERYVGGIISAEGVVTHIILLPGDIKATWKKAKKWAEDQGGDLPNRVEQALLFATCADDFEKDYYWSNTLRASYSGYAWCQDFGYGGQDYSLTTGYKLRARAVRRLTLQ